MVGFCRLISMFNFSGSAVAIASAFVCAFASAFVCAFAITVGFAPAAHASQFAIIGEMPHRDLSFVKSHLDEIYTFGSNSSLRKSASWIFSVLKKTTSEKVDLLNVSDGRGLSTWDTITTAIEFSAKYRIVMLNFGPVNNRLCQLLEVNSNTLYLVAAGNGSFRLDRENYGDCAAGNILMVTAYNQNAKSLMPFANWGPPVKLAVPASQLLVQDHEGTKRINNVLPGQVLVLSGLMKLDRQNPKLTPFSLIDLFINRHSYTNSTLVDRVRFGRVTTLSLP